MATLKEMEDKVNALQSGMSQILAAIQGKTASTPPVSQSAPLQTAPSVQTPKPTTRNGSPSGWTAEQYAERAGNRSPVYMTVSGKFYRFDPLDDSRVEIPSLPDGLVLVGYDPRYAGGLSTGGKRLTVAYADRTVPGTVDKVVLRIERPR